MVSSEGIREGGRAVIEISAPWGSSRWVAEHFNVQAGREFSDRQLQGPFRSWTHTHSFEPLYQDQSTLTDVVVCELPLSPLSDLFAANFVKKKLSAMFAYRHRVLSNDLSFWASIPEKKMKRVLLTGSRGLIGRELAAFLRQAGYDVIGLSRTKIDGDSQTVLWDLTERTPIDGTLLLDGRSLDAVIHLAGEGIAESRWTDEQKSKLARSRIEATHNLIAGLKSLGLTPQVFISASGVGIYGDRGDEVLTESSGLGHGFLSDLALAWESAGQQAEQAFAARAVQFRMSTVLTPRGGALAKMMLPFKSGLGGRLGHGRQWMSWVALDDVLYAIAFALESSNVRGPVNLVSPQPVRNLEFTRILGEVLGRPAIFPVPRFALRLALGEMADELLLASQRAQPELLMHFGFKFRFPDLRQALMHMLGKAKSDT